MVPTGKYDRHQAINLGVNRYKYDFQIGWLNRFIRNFALKCFRIRYATEKKEYGDGNQALKQNPTFQIQKNIRHNLITNTKSH